MPGQFRLGSKEGRLEGDPRKDTGSALTVSELTSYSPVNTKTQPQHGDAETLFLTSTRNGWRPPIPDRLLQRQRCRAA